ncbi:MAG: hypothetical protein ISS76_13650 [Phycisphaerae bacterium]|nr:hypothetical protein [Phycisphaerae bacterium]
MKRLSFWFLIVTLTLQVQAAVPEPKGVWEFNAPNQNSATVGAPLEIVGSALNITGVSAEDGAMTIGEGSYFICTHGIAPNGDGAKVNEWTLLIDFSYPPSSLSDPPNGYNDLFQTDPTNASDADWTINSSGAIGIGAVGYSGASGFTTQANTWYRMVVVVDNGVRHDLYVDGVEIFKGNQQGIDGRFSLADTLLLFAAGNNQDGDDATINVSTVAIWDIPLTSNEILILGNAGQSSFGDYPLAAGPVPADGALHADTWVNMAWRAGDYAVSHDVYFGDNFDDVDAGAESVFQGNQTDTFLVAGFPGFAYPDGLVPGTTYYWRIDEVNDAEPNSPWKGNVWSFSIPPKTAYVPDPADSAESVSVDVILGWTAGWGAKLHTVYFGETFEEVYNATGGLPKGTAAFTPGTLKMAKTYYWRVDEFDAIETYTGDVWSFTTEGAVAALDPANGAVDVKQTPVLTWAPGLGASHEIYFGADAASLELKGSGNLGAESYEPGQLEWNTTYYWRIDEADNANADSPWTGPLWSFTTANFLIIDDMESYNDLDESDPASNRIYLAWIDGFDNPAANGSVVGYANPPFAEQTIVHGGLQSMPMAYDNAVGKSEATLTLTSNKDWAVNGVTTLTIWFRGKFGNTAETLYVALNGNARVDNDNPDAALRGSWTQWNIPLQAFADQGVNFTNVNSITIGLSSVTGGTGMMYFDDIRLYPPAQ